MHHERPLSAMLRDGTARAHEAAERQAFVAELVGGRVGPEHYVAYLRRLLVVYTAIERVGDRLADDPLAGALVDPALHRAPALEQDLDALSPGWRTVPAASAAADAYADRVHGTAGSPHRFVAHHYVRYLGDLSGGRVVGRVMDGVLGGTGTAFYDFPLIPKPKPYKDDYRARLDALPLDARQRAETVDEAVDAFGLNEAVFAELGAVG